MCVRNERSLCVYVCERERKKREKGDNNFYMLGIIEEKREQKDRAKERGRIVQRKGKK